MRGQTAASAIGGGQLSRRAKIIIAVALGSAVLALAIGPFLLMTLPDPKPYRLAGLDGERSGTFIAVSDGYYKLYPYSAPLFDFPADAFVVSTAQPTLVVKFRQANALGLFNLTRYGVSGQILLSKTPSGSTMLTLTPAQPLVPGDYVLTAPRDSVDEQIDNFYFRVSG